ncbi:MAG TPA: oxygenase MpaB family protein [Polyangiaceae bacterium]|nr:oxygenase MpaB family protein [Polyangiaceae bacterium]
MIATRAELERFIHEIGASVSDPRAGIYGPGSASWQINRESILFLGAGRASLLQLAHPWVAHGVDQHSATRSDPFGRFRRTFDSVFGIIFGDLEKAFTSARRVHALHDRVTGEITEDVAAYRSKARYFANDEQALLWVHATLIETALQVYDLVVRPLQLEERDRYYQESKRFARLFGISDRVLPADWSSFAKYWEKMLSSDVLGVGAPAREIAGFLLRARHPVHRPLGAWFRMITAGLLPERFRHEFGFRFGTLERQVFRSSLVTLRAVYPRLPVRLRSVPAYTAAQRRLALSVSAPTSRNERAKRP